MSASNRIESAVERVLFFSRWFQAPMYLGLAAAGFVYCYRFLLELWHLVHGANALTEEVFMLTMLTLIDITMVSNLLVMVIIGGYATFVSRLHLDDHEDRPDWLDKVDAGSIKVKMAASLVGISGVHLLKTFVNIGARPQGETVLQTAMHLVFVVSALLLAFTDKLGAKKKAET